MNEVLGVLLPRRVFDWVMAPQAHDFQPLDAAKPDMQNQCVRCGAFRWGRLGNEHGCPRFRRWFRASVLVKP